MRSRGGGCTLEDNKVVLLRERLRGRTSLHLHVARWYEAPQIIISDTRGVSCTAELGRSGGCVTAPYAELKLHAMVVHSLLSGMDLTRQLTTSLQATLVKEPATTPLWCGNAIRTARVAIFTPPDYLLPLSKVCIL